MNLDLSGKIVMVTGASSGIGAAVSRVFAGEGAHVIICFSSNKEGAEETAAAVRSTGVKAWTIGFDLRSGEEVRSAMGQVRRITTGLDALVLCAGKNIVTPFEKVSDAEWDDVLAANLNGPFYMIREAASLMRDGSCIVNVASVAAHTGAPHHPHYAAAKAGLVNLTKSAARALAPSVRVNCVAPGITLTPMGLDTTAALDVDYAKKHLLLGRYAQPDEIARWVVFTASPAAGFMTGATIDVNGGRDLR